MWRLASVFVLMGGMSLLAGSARSQDTAVLLLETNLPEALVYLDSVRVGTAAQEVFAVPAGPVRLRLVAPGGDAWSIAPREEMLDAAPGDTFVVALPFPYHYRIESIPFGATVQHETVAGWRPLGETPLVYRAEAPLEGRLRVEKAGYLPETLAPGQAVWNRHVVTLPPVVRAEAQTAEVAWSPPRPRRRWIDYAAGAVAVGAGALAVHYKFRADDLDDAYRASGDPALRADVRRLDVRSTVALGVMQAGLGVLAVRFALR